MNSKKLIYFFSKQGIAWVVLAFIVSAATQANVLFFDSPPNGLPPSPKDGNDNRVYLLHADKLDYDRHTHGGAQRLVGRVAFRHAGMTLHCDSALLYETENSFEAYGHVRMKQGDTLTLTSETLSYDGNEALAQARMNVVLTHREQVLTTDSLDYDRLAQWAFFTGGGKLLDGRNVLTANNGDYFTDSRTASFFSGMTDGVIERVVLDNEEFHMVTDTLNYDTQTKWAEVQGPTTIDSDSTHIVTQYALYNSVSEEMRLMKKSEITSGGNHIVGDSLYYDKLSGDMMGFRNIVYTDTVGKRKMTGNYCHYNEHTSNAIAYDKALLMDFADGKDTLYMHADTIRLKTLYAKTDSVKREVHAYFHVRAYRRDIQAVADSMVYKSENGVLSLFRDPIAWSDNRQILGEEINVYRNDSTIDSIYVRRQAILVEQVDSAHFNQVSGQLMRSYFQDGQLSSNNVNGNAYVVNYPIEKDSTLLYQNYLEAPELRMQMKNRKVHRIWAGTAPKGCFYVIGTAPEERTFLSNFAWFDYIRPQNKDDLFEWRPKKSGMELKPSVRHVAPMQKLKKNQKPQATE